MTNDYRISPILMRSDIPQSCFAVQDIQAKDYTVRMLQYI